MLTGFLMSVLGSALIDGASPGLVAAGVLPVAWLALITTVEMALDLTSPLAVRVIERVDPGRLLVLAEVADSVACTICLILLVALRVPPGPLLVIYLLIAAILPLIIDIAEELYVAEVGRGDATAVIRFNAMAFSATAATALLVARPVGALISGEALPVLFAANFGLSLLAVATRWRATRLVAAPAFPSLADQPVGEAGESLEMCYPRWLSWERLKGWRAQQRRLGLVSPPISGVLSFIGGVCGYLPLWAAGLAPTRSSGVALAMAGVGLGRVIGPIAASRVAAWIGLRRGLPASVFCLSVILGITLLASLGTTPGRAALGPVVILLVLLGAATASSLTLLITLRQTELPGSLLPRATGRAHAFSAGGSIIGAWTGVALRVPDDPALGLGLSAAMAALLAVWMIGQEHPIMGPQSPRLAPGGQNGAR